MSKRDTMHRVVVFWDDGGVKDKYFLNSLGSEFHADLQEQVAELGPPTRIEFRAHGEGQLMGPQLMRDADGESIGWMERGSEAFAAGPRRL